MPACATQLRPGSLFGYSAGYLGGFDVFATAAPGDGLAISTLFAQGRVGAYLIGPGLAAVLGQINTYYGGGKAATVMATLGWPTTTPASGTAPAGPGQPLVVINSDYVAYPVLAADVVSQATALLALFTAGTNCNKGGNA